MKTIFKERRKHKRALFSIDQGLVGLFAVDRGKLDSDKKLMAPILDISKGGIGFVLHPNFGKNIGIDDRLLLTRLTINVGSSESVLALNPDLPVTVRGKIAADFLSHVGIGCDFNRITPNVWDQIRNFIEETYPNCIA